MAGIRRLVGLVCLTLVLPACTFSSEGETGDAGVISEVFEGEVPVPGAVTSVSEVGWEWLPGEGETASDVHVGPTGVVIELEGGLVGLRGDTGEELWRYQIPGAEGFSALFSPSGDRALVAPVDELAVLLDTTTGAAVAQDIDWDRGDSLLGGARLLDSWGEPTQHLIEVSDVESGETLWKLEAPVTCSEGESHRLISRRDHSEAIIFLIHCSEDTSEDALRVPEAGTVNALVALDPADGRELWRRESVDIEGRGLASMLMLQDTLVADLPGEEGWLIIDPMDGSVLAKSPKPVLTVNETDYLAGPDPFVDDPTYELRTFEGEVSASTTLLEERWYGDTPETAVGLPEQLVTLDMVRGSPRDEVNAVVTPWGDEGSDEFITGTTTDRASIFDPGRLLPVPGAILVYVPTGYDPRIEEVEHIVALQ